MSASLLRRFALLAAGGLASCSPLGTVEPPRAVSLDQPFALSIGERVHTDGQALRISFEAVVEDSRCPVGVVCVWEGNARVRLAVQHRGEEPIPVELDTSTRPTPAAGVAGYRIELERVEPDPKPQGEVPRERYRAHLRVTRAG